VPLLLLFQPSTRPSTLLPNSLHIISELRQQLRMLQCLLLIDTRPWSDWVVPSEPKNSTLIGSTRITYASSFALWVLARRAVKECPDSWIAIRTWHFDGSDYTSSPLSSLSSSVISRLFTPYINPEYLSMFLSEAAVYAPIIYNYPPPPLTPPGTFLHAMYCQVASNRVDYMKLRRWLTVVHYGGGWRIMFAPFKTSRSPRNEPS
jgi:hypothetical protein